MEKRIIENEQEAFKVPDGYFEGFEERLMSRIQQEEQPVKPAKEANTKQLWINRVSIAVGIVGMLMLATAAIIRTQDEIDVKTQQIITANANENDAYYDEINDKLSNEEIEEALAQIEFNEEGIY
ncbi:MAG: hypothetical protein MJ002_03055 [Paludibacteraceae bacterium]|nr:hypothetical protein [Paludibacteraceae bacterium]